MFSKIDKKVLLTLIVALVAILLSGFIIYKYTVNPAPVVKVQNLTGGAKTDSKSSPKPIVDAPTVEIQAQGGSGAGFLSICLDRCGDGTCQKTDPNCGKKDNLNCICPETHQECPQDCK
ncbi:MAG: hypothetical protein NT155_04415 [Candidatus Staskawiczbacteria bacterium]|nr:hypothetical protein [Candidatus Staskawiczbacteria bacterium]